MEAGVTDHLWTLLDIVKLTEDAEPAPGSRGSYKINAMTRRVEETLGVYNRMHRHAAGKNEDT